MISSRHIRNFWEACQRSSEKESPGAQSSTSAPNSEFRTHSALRAGFSLIEILLVVAMLTVIILGLVAMFNTTRRAFTSSMTQVDVLESGRSIGDLLAREIEQMTPTAINTVSPPYYNAPNFFVDTPAAYFTPPLAVGPVIQPLTAPGDVWTNDLQQVYFVVKNNNVWTSIGYRLTNYSTGIGTLYRFGSANIYTSNYNVTALLASNFSYFLNTNITSTNTSFSRLIDGVVDFRIRAYDTNGLVFGRTNIVNANTVYVTNYFQSMGLTNDYYYYFSSNSLPAYVEIEIGVLEDRTLARYNALTNAGMFAALGYLTNHPGAVHIFRQRIQVHNVNPAAYQ